MFCERIWERKTFWSSEEGYFDHELVLAAARGEYNEVKRLMEVSTQPQGDLETVLDACSRASLITGTVKWMTENRVWRNCSTGGMGLYAASLCGREAIVQLLLDDYKVSACATIEIDGVTRTALVAAARSRHEKVVQLLLDHNADVNAPAAGRTGRTALQAAAEGGHQRVVQLLLHHKADINALAAEEAGRTALQAAAAGGQQGVVKLLLDHGADVNIPATWWEGRTALQAAAEGGHEKVVQLLLDHKADVNAPAAQGAGKLALQAAAEGGHEKVVQLLLDCGADVNAPRKKIDGRTALEAAYPHRPRSSLHTGIMNKPFTNIPLLIKPNKPGIGTVKAIKVNLVGSSACLKPKKARQSQ